MPTEFGNEEVGALLASLARSHGRLYYKLAYGILRERTAAEDACQQAYVKALERSKELRSAQAMKSWLGTVVVREALVVRRRRQIEARALPLRARADESAPHASDQAMRQGVLDALEKLADETRVVVVLRILNDCSGAEVKDLLGCSESHVSRELHSGMKLLRELLQEWQATVDN